MPKKYPEEFKSDVVMVARRGDLSVHEVATDFGVAEETVRRWMRQADVDDGVRTGRPAANAPSWCACVGRSAAWRWRTRSCAAQRPISPPRHSQNDVPAGP